MRSPQESPADGPTRVVLLGATGFVGSAVLRRLAAHPVRVRAVSRRPARVPDGATAEIEVHARDLTAPGAVADVVADADVVVHTVAHITGSSTWRIEDGDSTAERVNVGLVHDLVEAARRRGGTTPQHVVFTGATSQIGPPEHEVLDGSEPDRPRDEYGRQKLAAEQALLAADAAGLLRCASVRLPTMYGYVPESTARDKGVVATMVRRAVAGERITMWHDGTVRRDLLHVEDAAAGLVTAALRVPRLAGRSWLLGTGHSEPLGEVFRTIAALVAARTGTSPVDVVSVPPPDYAEPSDFRSVTIDSSAFRAVTGWRPVIPLAEGLRRAVDFCVAGGELALHGASPSQLG